MIEVLQLVTMEVERYSQTPSESATGPALIHDVNCVPTIVTIFTTHYFHYAATGDILEFPLLKFNIRSLGSCTFMYKFDFEFVPPNLVTQIHCHTNDTDGCMFVVLGIVLCILNIKRFFMHRSTNHYSLHTCTCVVVYIP